MQRPSAEPALREALTRFADTVVMIWYPQLRTVESVQLPHRLQSAADTLAKKGWLHVRLSVQQAYARGARMRTAGRGVTGVCCTRRAAAGPGGRSTQRSPFSTAVMAAWVCWRFCASLNLV